jgi:DNA-binding NarL/FixJ family response regulator
MRILLADDHTLVRSGIRRLVESFVDMEVVAEAARGDEVMDLISMHRPDVAVLDISMPGRGGIELTADLASAHPDVAVVIMSMHADMDYVQRALRAGAKGFVVKEAAPAELELALRAALSGQTYLSPMISARMVRAWTNNEPMGAEDLPARQREILAALGKGRSTKEIAADLGISVKTVETHRARLMEKLGLKRPAELVHYAVRNGLA